MWKFLQHLKYVDSRLYTLYLHFMYIACALDNIYMYIITKLDYKIFTSDYQRWDEVSYR